MSEHFPFCAMPSAVSTARPRTPPHECGRAHAPTYPHRPPCGERRRTLILSLPSRSRRKARQTANIGIQSAAGLSGSSSLYAAGLQGPLACRARSLVAHVGAPDGALCPKAPLAHAIEGRRHVQDDGQLCPCAFGAGVGELLGNRGACRTRTARDVVAHATRGRKRG